MFCYMLGCPVAVLLAERNRLYTCARIVLHCDGSGDVVCVQILCANQTSLYLYHKSSWYPLVHCSCHLNPFRTCDKLQDTSCSTYISGLGPYSSVGVATRYGLDSPGIESRWGGEIFRIQLYRPWGPPTSYTMGAKSFPGVKRPGRGVDHPPPSRAEVKEGVEVYLCFPYGTFWPVLG